MVDTLSRKELISRVKEKGWEITRGEKPKPLPVTPEVQNERLVKSVINAIDDMNVQSKTLSDNLIVAAKIMAEIAIKRIEPTKESTTTEKRKWNMDVVRDGKGLIKRIEAKEI